MTVSNKFLIFIPTYNRNNLLNKTIESVMNQTYKNFILYISDNQSDIPVIDSIPNKYKDDNSVFIERQSLFYTTGVEHCDIVIPKLLKKFEFDYFLNLADDDYLLENILFVINSYGNTYKYIMTNYITYYQNQKYIEYPLYNSEYYILDANEQILNHCTDAGIKILDKVSVHNDNNINSEIDTIYSHVSSIFIHKEILVEVIRKFQKVSVEPFGDVGYGLLASESKSVLYVCQPLMVARMFANYGMIDFKNGRRLSLINHHKFYTDNRPIHGVSFTNGAFLSYASLLDKLNITYDRNNPSIKMLLRHLREILYDSPKDIQTYIDLKEILFKILTIKNLREIFKYLLHKKFYYIKKNILDKKIINDIDDIDDIKSISLLKQKE